MKNKKQNASMADSDLMKNQALESNTQLQTTKPKQVKPTQKPNAKDTRVRRPNIFKRMWRGLKEIFSELKKVSWPTMAKTMSNTGVVLMVVGLFLLVLLGIDSGFSALFNLLVQPK